MDHFSGGEVGADEGENAVVKEGGGSEGWLPEDCWPEHVCKLSRKDQERRGVRHECNKGAGSLCSMSVFSGIGHSLCVSIRAGVGA